MGLLTRVRDRLRGKATYYPRVSVVEVVGDHALRLTFTDGLVRDVDLTEILWGPVMEPLRDPAYFARVRIDEASGTIAWPNGVDLDPFVLHGDFEPDWPDGVRRADDCGR